MKKICILFLTLCISIPLFAQYLDLEGSVPANWKADVTSALSISDEHSKLGTQSVRWDWKPGSSLTIANPEGMKVALQKKEGGMMLWIYNTCPLEASLHFEFGRDSQPEYEFTYRLSFTGWRACWIRFNEDMQGPKNSRDLDYLKITAPQAGSGGTLFFDRMKFPAAALSSRLTPDAQLPDINPLAAENHWTALWHWYRNYRYTLEKREPDAAIRKDLKEIEQQLTAQAAGKAPAAAEILRAKEQFRGLGIKRSEQGITGPALVAEDEYQLSNKDLKMRQAGDLMLVLAKGWYFLRDAECRQMFFDLTDHLVDQGWAVGSGMGTNHHYGYQFRAFAPSFLLMKEALIKAGKLTEYTQILLYWCGIPELREEPVPGSLQGVIDSWNTLTLPRLIAISLQEELAQRDLDFRCFKRWMEASLEYSPGTTGGIKPDGTGFHHGGLYPAYCTGGFSGAGEYVAITGHTGYELNAKAKANLKQALLTMVRYSVYKDWGFGICGRHPLAGTLAPDLIRTIGTLAACKNPENGAPIDRELAAVYLRLNPKPDDLSARFTEAGVKPAPAPSGFFTYNYGALGIHRRDNWMVSIKGYNKYVWSSEIYTADNRFGRYQSYGTVQIMNAGDPVSSARNGFLEKGWDWNRYPGATVIHLPLDLLESPYPGTLMEKSEETFAGALSLNGQNGIFGMKLRENDRPHFTPGFTARKSVFCFDNRIICLGSGITNSNSRYPTETILFQTALTDEKAGISSGNGTLLRDFPSETNLNPETANWITDLNGNGYYLPAAQPVTLSKARQHSKHNKTKAPTTGNFVSARINHGLAPQNSGYEYAIWINAGARGMKEVARKMESKAEKLYDVVKKTDAAHIVTDRQTGITGMVLFEAHSADTAGMIIDNSLPCLVMYCREKNNQLRLSLVNPDLSLPDNSYTSDKPAQPTRVSVTLKGKWEILTASEQCKPGGYSNGNTLLDFTCKDGLPVEIVLKNAE